MEGIDLIGIQLATLEWLLRALARRRTSKALMRQYGIGELTSLVALCEPSRG